MDHSCHAACIILSSPERFNAFALEVHSGPREYTGTAVIIELSLGKSANN